MYVRQHLVENGQELQLVEGICLVILPQTGDAEEFYVNVLEPVLSEIGLQPGLAKGVYDSGYKAVDTVEDIVRSEFILADLTVPDPHVLYHLGQALVFRDEVLLVTQDPSTLPFNFAEYPVIHYSPDTEGMNSLRQEIADRFSEVLGMERQHIDPMSTFGFSAPLIDEAEMDAAQAEINNPEEPISATDRAMGFPLESTKTENETPIPAPPTERFEEMRTEFLSPSAAIPGINDAIMGDDEHGPTKMLTENLSESDIENTGAVGTINVDASIKKGFEYRTLGMHKEALKEFQKVVDVKPDSPKILNIIGDLYSETGDYTNAINAYSQATEADPDNFTAYSGLGICYSRRKMHYEAINAYAEAIRIKPEDPAVLSNLGASYNALKMVDDALEAYQQALLLDPESPKVYFNIGNAHYNQKNFPEAITAYEKALELNGSYEKARRNLEKAIKKQQESL